MIAGGMFDVAVVDEDIPVGVVYVSMVRTA
jgi:hypothetical protein